MPVDDVPAYRGPVRMEEEVQGRAMPALVPPAQKRVTQETDPVRRSIQCMIQEQECDPA